MSRLLTVLYPAGHDLARPTTVVTKAQIVLLAKTHLTPWRCRA